MSIEAQPVPGHDHIVQLKVSWSVYNALVEELGDDSHARLTYDGETLEIMSPGSKHELIANIISDMITTLSLEWSIDLTNFGSTTFKTEPRGFEAEKSYYLDARRRIRDIENIDLTVDPPPDLVVEVDISSDSRQRLMTYAALRVPEVWRYNRGSFTVLTLSDGNYTEASASRIASGLPAREIAQRIEIGYQTKGETTLAIRAKWQQWLRENRHLHESA